MCIYGGVGCNDALSVTMPRASMRDPPRVRSVSCNDVDAATGQISIGPFFLILPCVEFSESNWLIMDVCIGFLLFDVVRKESK